MYRKLLIAIDPEDDAEGERALEAGTELLAEGAKCTLPASTIRVAAAFSRT
ncbi:hypothetical protein ACFQGA_06050 [Marinobacter koreensis]|uniref:hypothetical protein n=1 Tax=Marinobacter koreensis TaxID=335974 RepID=UPI003606498E